LQRCLTKNDIESNSNATPWELGFQLLPAWHTTDAFEGDALMPVPKIEHEQLKQNYEQKLAQHFETQPEFWASKNVSKLEFYSNEGTANISGPGGRPPHSKGGLQVFLVDEKGKKLGFLWMRGSGTEPVFRVVVDWSGSREGYLELFQLHRALIQQSVI
jgi:phosphoglucomutase